MFHKVIKYRIVIQVPEFKQNFYKSEIENKTKFQKILKYGIAIQVPEFK